MIGSEGVDVERIADSPLLVALTMEQIARFLESGAVIDFAERETIFREGSPGDSLYLILDGRVEIVSSDQAPVAVLSGEQTLLAQYEGDFFGEMSILDHERRAATVRAAEPTRVFRIERDAFYKLFEKDTDFQVVLLTNMSRILSRRLRSSLHKIAKG